jgi:hypothetical protein
VFVRPIFFYMLLFDNCASVINKRPFPDVKEIDFVEEDPGVHKHAGSDKEAGFRIQESRRNHANTILLFPYFHGMACIGPYATPGYDCGMILKCDMSNDLSLSFVTEKSADDNGTTHYQTIKYGEGVEIKLLLSKREGYNSFQRLVIKCSILLRASERFVLETA